MSRKIALFAALLLVVAALPLSAANKAGVETSATRLASLLQDVQSTANVDATAWKTIANEANSLANRVYGYTAGNKTARSAATDLRMHVRELRKAAMAGDAAGARQHASEALPFAYKLIDWAK